MQAADPCACAAVKQLSRVLGRVYDAHLAPAGLNVTQYTLLRCIARHPGESLASIAAAMEMDRTSLYRAITPMLRDGWLIPGAGRNARSRSVRLSAAGRRLLARARQPWSTVQKQVIGLFGKKPYRALLKELDRLAACAGAEHRAPAG
jgi:DNA-binding MarR family transcriptional regulator